MKIIVNGQSSDVAADLTAEQLLESLGLTGKRLAMEVNRDIIPRSSFTTHCFTPGDQVEIVRAIGGG